MMNLLYVAISTSGNLDMIPYGNLYPGICLFCKTSDGRVALSTHGTCYMQPHSHTLPNSHKSYVWSSNLYTELANKNKQMDPADNLANYEHIHTYLFHVLLGLGYRIPFYNKTYKSLHLQYSCGSILPVFTPHNEHRHKIICKDIQR